MGPAAGIFDQLGDEFVGGTGGQLARRSHLDQAPVPHHRDPVGHQQGFGHVMGDHQGGQAQALVDPADIGGQVGGGSFIGAIQDIYNLAAERSLSGFDQTHRFVQTIIYDVPFFRHTKGVARQILDGWQVSTIATAQSGFTAAVTNNVDTTATGKSSRPDLLAGQSGNLDSGDRTYKRWFNTSAFAAAPLGRFGTSPRTGAIRLPGLINQDFSVNKQFKIGESRRFEFRTEIFNLWNHYNPDPGTVDLALNSQTFGAIGGGGRGVTTRVIQLGAKLYF